MTLRRLSTPREERSLDARLSVSFARFPDLLAHHAERIPDAPAILAERRAPMSYGRLHQQIDTIGRALRGMGIGPHDRVAVVLPNGPELAVAILAVAASAACAPLNPAYGAEELDRYFADLRPRAVVTQAGAHAAARRAAHPRGVLLIGLSAVSGAEAGLFKLAAAGKSAPFREPVVSADDTALLLPTSGTTSRPKIVPQTHANVCVAAYAQVATFALKESDRCLNVVPLFHGHGLHATLMASLAAGASLLVPP